MPYLNIVITVHQMYLFFIRQKKIIAYIYPIIIYLFLQLHILLVRPNEWLTETRVFWKFNIEIFSITILVDKYL